MVKAVFWLTRFLRRNHQLMLFKSFHLKSQPLRNSGARCFMTVQFNGSLNNANVAIIELNCSLCVSGCCFFYRGSSNLSIYSRRVSTKKLSARCAKTLKQLTNKFAKWAFFARFLLFRVGRFKFQRTPINKNCALSGWIDWVLALWHDEKLFHFR